MAKKKSIKKLPARRIEVFQDENAKSNRDSWNWRRVYGKDKHGKPKVRYGNGGFDSERIARAQANSHKKELNFKIEVITLH